MINQANDHLRRSVRIHYITVDYGTLFLELTFNTDRKAEYDENYISVVSVPFDPAKALIGSSPSRA